MSRAVLTLDGRVLRYEITEKFVNRGGTLGETDYLLPLPPHAAFEDLALSIDGEMVTGETMGADKARAIYEEIVRRQRDPALVEWMGQGLLRTRIFPIAPGEEKTVVVRFRAVAPRSGEAWRIDSRPPVRTGDDEARSTFELRYAARGEYGRAFSPTHDLQLADQGSLRTARVERVRSVVTALVPLRATMGATVHVLTHATDGEDGYAMITIAPPPASRTVTPRDVTFVMDVSGSMTGAKLEQARNAGLALLGALAASDRFRIIAFSSDVRLFREEWMTATTANVRAGQTFLRGLRAEGSTNISAALEAALQADTREGRLPLTLFLTDGAPTVGERNPDRIAALADRLRGRQRVFTFGVGADVNAALLEQLALSGRGTAQFVRPEEDVERAVGVVSQRLANPVATDLRVRVDGVRLDRVQPNGAFDLFAGQEVTLFARYHGGRRAARVTVEGTSVDGPVRWMTTAEFPGRADENAFVARLWAVQRVGWLSAERRRNGGTAELDDELRALGTRFGIPTELTSYLVVEPGMQRNLAAVGGVARDKALNAPVASPAMATRTAFEAAKAAADQRAVRSLEQLDAATRERREATQFVLGRIFTLTDGVWRDEPTSPPTRVVKVVAYSAAYFALLQRVPALADVFALGERVAVQGRGVRLVLDAQGDTTLNAGALDAFVRDW
ncbi:MAG: VWA domain-containing protein [Gemmatimonadaceae bacterium]|nr:VWA domain-containing protein [Gemmatimonadaceae bacterium]